MRVHCSLLQSVRVIAPASPKARLVARSLADLLRQRRLRLAVLGPLLLLWPLANPSRRSYLWRVMACIGYGLRSRRSDLDAAFSALQSSHTYQQAERRMRCSVVSPFTRGRNYREILAAWRVHPPERLLIFHHFDRRGYFPRSWLQQLMDCQADGWQILVSTSFLSCSDYQMLRDCGFLIAERVNQGLCLGAYRDLALLMQSDLQIRRNLRSLVLCNDSILPVADPAVFVDQLRSWTHFDNSSQATLAGLTDSAQRGAYHLQSYCLYANPALLRSERWLQFWQNFIPSGSKDELIDKGELGLSQYLLSGGVCLEPSYPLIRLLLSAKSISEELQRFRIEHPMHVNTTLFAWQSLLSAGFPFVKKQILFDQINLHAQPVALTSLTRWIGSRRIDMLQRDLEQLFVSRFSAQRVDS